MSSPPTLTPGSVTGWNRTTYKAGFEDATHQAMVFTDIIDEYGTRLLTTGTVRKHARSAPGTVLAQADEGNSLTATNIIATPVTISAAGRYIMASWSANERAQVDADLRGEAGSNLQDGMAETLDQAGLALVASLTQTISQASVDASMWRKAVGQLMGNTNGKYGPGMGDPIYGIFSHTQYPNVMQIEEFTHADIRGDSENASAKGVFAKGGGINVRYSTVVYQDGSGWWNAVFVKPAFVVGWNEDIHLEDDKTQLRYDLIGYANNGYAVQHDLRGIALVTTASGL